jgi:8-oxo-dGTP pyrophosphatase MutT (NUDIX family)
MIGVGVVVRRSDGRVLLGRRIKSGEQPSWCFPGGRIEPGEDPAACAARELAEETGIVATRPPLAFGLVVDTLDGHPRATLGFTCDVTSAHATVREPDRFERWEWCEPGSLPAPLFPATAHLLALQVGRILDGVAGYRVETVDGR